MSAALAIGSYAPADAQALRAMGARMIRGPGDLAALAEAERAAVRAVAYAGHQPFGAADMDLLPALRGIANFGVGYDAIDVAAATARGITVTNTPDVLTDDVADLAVAMWITQARGFEAGIAAVRSGDWARHGPQPLGRRASGRRVGVLGLGRIGRAIATRLAAFGGPVHYFARSPRETPGWTYHPTPEALARAVDDLFVATVGGLATAGLVSAPVLAALGSDGVVINIARGSVIDEAALIAALRDGTIRGAALDVFAAEPAVDPRLAGLPNLLPLPHIGSATVETRAAMAALQRRNLAALLAGTVPETPVN